MAAIWKNGECHRHGAAWCQIPRYLMYRSSSTALLFFFLEMGFWRWPDVPSSNSNVFCIPFERENFLVCVLFSSSSFRFYLRYLGASGQSESGFLPIPEIDWKRRRLIFRLFAEKLPKFEKAGKTSPKNGRQQGEKKCETVKNTHFPPFPLLVCQVVKWEKIRVRVEFSEAYFNSALV